MSAESNLENGSQLSRQNRNREYLYRQLADIIQGEINDGKYKPGDRLLSMDALASKYSVNKVTVRRALAELSQQGMIYSIPAQGTYIAEPPPPRTLTKKPFLTVGLLSPMMVAGNTGFYHMQVIDGIRDALEKIQANLVMLPVKYVNSTGKVLDLLIQANLDAVILLGHFDPVLLRRILAGGPPSVLVDHVLRGSQIDTVLVDNRGGGFQAMEHLCSLGHRKMAVVTGPQEQVVTKERLQGMKEAMEQNGIPESSVKIIAGDFQRESGFQTVADLLRSDFDATAIFLMNDEMAAGALQALHSYSSLKVPEDISIMGFDDTSLSMATQPPLTTVQVSKMLMGRLAVQRAIAQLKDPEHSPTTVMVPTQLVVRNSTAAPPAKRVMPVSA